MTSFCYVLQYNNIVLVPDFSLCTDEEEPEFMGDKERLDARGQYALGEIDVEISVVTMGGSGVIHVRLPPTVSVKWTCSGNETRIDNRTTD